MIRATLHLLPLLLLAAPASAWHDAHVDRPRDGITCETVHEPVPIRKGVYVLEHYTRCYSAPPLLEDRLHSACDLLVEAWGPVDGARRCDDLVERIADLD